MNYSYCVCYNYSQRLHRIPGVFHVQTNPWVFQVCGSRPVNCVQLPSDCRHGAGDTYTSSMRSPRRTPARWAAPPSSTALTCCIGAYSSPLMLRSWPPSLTYKQPTNFFISSSSSSPSDNGADSILSNIAPRVNKQKCIDKAVHCSKQWTVTSDKTVQCRW